MPPTKRPWRVQWGNDVERDIAQQSDQVADGATNELTDRHRHSQHTQQGLVILMRLSFVRLAFLSWLPLLAVLTGCGEPSVDPDLSRTRLRGLCRALSLSDFFIGHEPRNREELLTTVRGMIIQPEIEDRDSILISPRDSEPYVVIYGSKLIDGNKDNARSTVIAYEQKGAEGKRYVLMAGQNIEVLSDQEFANAKFALMHKP